MYPVSMPEGFVHLALDRPGYGLSDPQPGRNAASHAADVAAVAHELGIARLSVFGWSGGTGPALGVAAGLAERVARAVVVAGRSPVDSPVFEPELRDGVLSNLDQDRADCQEKARLYREDRDAYFAWMESFVPDVEEFRRLRPQFIACYDAAFAAGGEGWFEDDVQLVTPWGFHLEDVRCEVQLWHAEADRMVPIQHGRHLAQQLPRCEPHLVAGEAEDHGTLVRHLPDMCRWLAVGL